VGDLDAKRTSHDEIVSMMVGRDFSTWFPKRRGSPGEEVFRAEGLVVPGAPGGVSFAARRGEILGFAGLVGSGRTELMRVIFGVEPALGGGMRLEGAEYAPRGPAAAIRRGIFLAPEDRKLHGLVLGMPIASNISLPDIASYGSRWLLGRRIEREKAEAEVRRLAIKTPSIRQRVVNLSGGNQQKVVLGKWLAMEPRILILDEPTRGIDVGAKAEIYRSMADLADQGITILMVSSEMEEVIGMSDRVVVMHERRITGILEREELGEESIMARMTGKERAA
jgi:ribose transport system ATP-binding protein